MSTLLGIAAVAVAAAGLGGQGCLEDNEENGDAVETG